MGLPVRIAAISLVATLSACAAGGSDPDFREAPEGADCQTSSYQIQDTEGNGFRSVTRRCITIIQDKFYDAVAIPVAPSIRAQYGLPNVPVRGITIPENEQISFLAVEGVSKLLVTCLNGSPHAIYEFELTNEEKIQGFGTIDQAYKTGELGSCSGRPDLEAPR